MTKFYENTSIKLRENILISHIDNDIVIFNQIDGKIYSFNKTGKTIIELIKNKITIKDLISNIMQRYDINFEDCYNDVSKFIYDLYKKHLIELYE